MRAVAVLACAASSSTSFADSANSSTAAHSWTLSGVVKTAYDDNVFLQDSGPLAARGSMVTTFVPQFGATFAAESTKLTLTYAPEITVFNQERGEDFVAHKGAAALSGRVAATAWDNSASFTWIDGASRNLVFSGVGGAPAGGGVPIRERRDALVLRDTLKATIPWGASFVRPLVSVYLHDFRSEQSTTPGYQNYADRSDISFGADFGRRDAEQRAFFVGYRCGWQDQERLFGTGAAYDNRYQRVLFGYEGAPWPFVKITAVAGPDFRNFGSHVAAGFEDGRTLLFADVAVAVTVARSDQVLISAKRFEQPGFGGRSVYEDNTIEATWKHTFSGKYAAAFGWRAYNTAFERPVLRDDWIYTWTASLSAVLSPSASLEVADSYDSAASHVPNTPAREFARNLVSLALRIKLH